ncbi:hypothetical protein R5R35_002895 [Gryllus longicercus]|uniref:Uncharacterized protein n=1 Tax=Gryllus longicercus TaxID=2509291 RepID=A0AAN9UZA7_9ORTH
MLFTLRTLRRVPASGAGPHRERRLWPPPAARAKRPTQVRLSPLGAGDQRKRRWPAVAHSGGPGARGPLAIYVAPAEIKGKGGAKKKRTQSVAARRVYSNGCIN